MKCQCCKEQQAEWAWQPFGPSEDTKTAFVLPGNHYRGFPVIKVCYTCKSAFETGDFPVFFEYKGYKYVGKDHKVVEVNPTFYDGGTTVLGNGSGTMIMKDGPDEDQLIAVVAETEWIAAFVAVPDLIEACKMIADAFSETAEYRLTSAQDSAIVRACNALACARGER